MKITRSIQNSSGDLEIGEGPVAYERELKETEYNWTTKHGLLLLENGDRNNEAFVYGTKGGGNSFE